MSDLSIWAIQRDNGKCAGGRAANNCSGITQGTWDFSHLLSTFTGPDPSQVRVLAGFSALRALARSRR